MKKLFTLFVVLALIAISSNSLFAIVKVGEEILQRFESPHPYDGKKDVVWEQEFYYPEAGYIAIHFSEFDLAKGDILEISDPRGHYTYVYKEKGKKIKNRVTNTDEMISAFWATHIPGDTAFVRLISKNKQNAYGVVIDKWVRGYEAGYIGALMADQENENLSRIEAICSSDDKEWAKCYLGTDMYNEAKAVCRLLMNGSSACTGWLLGSEGHVMTNEHCIGDQSTANNTDFEFMAEGATCSTSCTGWLSCPGTVEADSGTLIQVDASLDYALVLLPTNITGTYGYMQLRDTLPDLDERIYIPQHPGAKGKQLAVLSDNDGPYCKIYSVNETPCSGGPGDIGYYADTEGGSSGSPVLGYSDNLVVALHHCANCPNRGVPIPSIISDLGANLPNDAIGGGSPSPPTANFTGNPTTVTVGQSVNFTDTSSNNPTSWSWSFSGGSPSGSSAQNPTVTYNTVGTYDVGLTATNSAGSDIETKVNYITVTAPQPPVANFTASTTNPTVGGNVTFTDTSTNSPTSWSWSFEGGTPATSTAQNPTVTYNTVGTYDVSLTATNAQGSDIETKLNYITVSDIPYCASQGTNYSYEWIARVVVAGMDNSSGAAGYTDFTSITCNLTAGNNASVSLTPGFSSSTYTEYWKIWIDYNGDHDFVDTGEEVFSGSGTSTVSGSFTVASVDRTTRMRVTMKYSGAPTSCETFTYGEVEDYTADINPGTPQPPTAAFTGTPTTVTVGGSVSFTDQSTNNPTSWSWVFQGGTPGTSSSQNPTVQYNTAGTYDVTLTAYNASGSDVELKTDYITVNPAGGDDIAEAVDYPTLTFTKTGNGLWSKVTDVYYYGGDSARSGTITHNQTSTIETTASVGTTQAVKFYWKVSSEASYDYLRFYIDGVEKTKIAGTVDWTQVSYNIAAGTHTLKWSYTKDGSVSTGSDCGWVDKLEITAPATDPIAEAVDYPGLTFTLSGNANWFSQTTTTYYGGDAAQSGDIGNSQTSTMETTISGKTSVKFYWRVSSETNYDYLRFYIDGVQQASISGSTSWAQKTYTVTSGTHTLKWSFTKDGSVSSGSDCGWVDKLELQ